MRCHQCGAQLADGVRLCEGCGAQVTDPTVTAPGPYGAPVATATSKRSFRPMLALVAVALVLLVGGGAAAALGLLPFGMSPKARFFALQAAHLKALAAEQTEAQKGQLELQRLRTEKPSRSELRLTAEIGGDLAEANAMLGNAELIVKSETDPATKISRSDVAVNFRQKELATVEFWQSPDTLALKMPFLYQEYLVLDNSNLGEFFEGVLGVPYQGPDHFGGTEVKAEAFFKAQGKAITDTLATYGRSLYDAIRADEVTREKQADYLSPDGRVKLERLVLSLSEERLKQVLFELADRFEKDERALDLMGETIAVLVEAGNMATIDPEVGAELALWSDPEYARAELRNGVDSFKEALDTVRFPGGLEWAIYVNGKEIAEQTLTLGLADEEDSFALIIRSSQWETKENVRHREGVISLAPKAEESDEDGLSLHWRSLTTRPTKDQVLTESYFNLQVYETSEEPVGLYLGLTSLTEKEAEQGKDRITYDFDFSLIADGDEGPAIYGQLVSLHSNAITKGLYEQDLDLYLVVESESDWDPSFDVAVSLATAIDFNAPAVSLPEFGANAQRLNSMSNAQLDRLMGELEMGVQRFIMRNLSLFMF